MNKEITRMLTISTAHIRQGTTQFLDDHFQDKVTAYSKGTGANSFGWFIYVPNDPVLIIDMFSDEEIPRDLRNCIGYAYGQNCQWLCLDRDGNVVEELEEYEW